MQLQQIMMTKMKTLRPRPTDAVDSRHQWRCYWCWSLASAADWSPTTVA